jgi:replicative DNA helicase
VQQLALGRCGFEAYADLLGFPIIPGQKRVLYLAMDRPKQAARSFRRMVGEPWRAALDAKLIVWQGPPPYDLARFPDILTRLCEEANADTVIVDSLKDAAIGLTDDEVGAGYNRARQHAIVNGIQVAELHHMRKASAAKAEHPTIDEVYGSTWITSGAGSVILLNGKPGDPIVSLYHLKQPAVEVGPFKVMHDQASGRSTIWHTTDLVLLAEQAGGIAAVDAAKALFETDKPTASEREKARRRLVKLEQQGLLVTIQRGDDTKNQATKWGRK